MSQSNSQAMAESSSQPKARIPLDAPGGFNRLILSGMTDSLEGVRNFDDALARIEALSDMEEKVKAAGQLFGVFADLCNNLDRYIEICRRGDHEALLESDRLLGAAGVILDAVVRVAYPDPGDWERGAV
ncbi:hypothetical protein SMMN14_03019 [Sphaerulina musiva]